ncbi:hypothetical protein HCN44_009261 [Aphidius gifuensis]|uniref:RRM domain-containing protein n=1 Tax=Aphidius gifuensis TaxID=684658 RepID=A0A835CXX3_APHGI|nr:RNA-binding protein 28-like [Aphidius gifuensis]KAF7997863.1 hypothetical protein HCN44_009261 [Aphidius gifuensis]
MGKLNGPRQDRKQLSWSYRNKKKQVKQNRPPPKATDNVQVQNKNARIIVRNLSFKVTDKDVRNLYEPFGEIEEIDLPRRPDGKLLGCGFVQFKRIEDASKAIFKTNKNEFLGRPINCTWAVSKAKFVEQLEQKKAAEKSQDNDKQNDTVNLDDTKNEVDDKEQTFEIVPNKNKIITNKITKNERKKMTPEERKQKKDELRKKRARIVVRNLSFKADENTLKEHFNKYGNIEEVKLLTRDDGKRAGVGFVQFERVQSAAMAIHYENMKSILERPIVVDWAVPKSKFVKSQQANDEDDNKNDIEIIDGVDDKNKEIKLDDPDEIKDEKSGDEDDDASVKEEDSEDEEDDDEDEEEEEDEDEDKKEAEVKEEKEPEKQERYRSHDVSEGKTVFIKNVPFSVKNDELKACMEQFGRVYYALVCMDPLTEHSKGTAFVKFLNAEDAEKCLAAGTELRLHDQVLDPHRALDSNDMKDPKSIKNQRSKDSRNLYLIKEGVILAGSPAAIDVSAADMARRLQLEQWKSQMLKNLNMFVSRIRLVVHNLPPTLGDAQFREICKKHAGPKAFITEARIMRDLKNPDANGIGPSKGFGFVAFSTHEDALKALRSLNNNPNIFTKASRPIVAFSIENRIMVNAKERRVQKSRDHNPLWQNKRKETSNDNNNDSTNDQSSKRPRYHEPNEVIEAIPEYSGVTSKPGRTKLRSKFNIKNQAELHKKVRQDQHKTRKFERKLKERQVNRQLSQKQIKPKQGSKKLSKEDVNLNKMIDSYKNKLSAPTPTKSKWYDN